MSCAAKNIFGTIPGITKPEYHYRFPNHKDFANMILDLDEYFHPALSIVDAVVGMEGNGPTAGTPRKIGCLLASRSPHTLDMVAARIIGLEVENVPTLTAARERGLIPDSIEELTVHGSYAPFVIPDFEQVVEHRSIRFAGDGKSLGKRLFSKLAGAVLRTKPKLDEKLCVGCGVCANICPAKAIVIKNKKAVINRKTCIRCFCCQEFCPKSAMKVKRTMLSKLVQKK
jgi:ferredoxin